MYKDSIFLTDDSKKNLVQIKLETVKNYCQQEKN